MASEFGRRCIEAHQHRASMHLVKLGVLMCFPELKFRCAPSKVSALIDVVESRMLMYWAAPTSRFDATRETWVLMFFTELKFRCAS